MPTKTDSTANELLDMLAESREYVEYFKELGVETIALGPRVASNEHPRVTAVSQSSEIRTERNALARSQPLTSAPKENAKPGSTLLAPVFTAPDSSLISEASETLEDIWRDIGDCTRCGLCEGRTQVVNTHGNRQARLMFIGEAPGADEDAQGRPFVGRAGQLLTKIIEAIGLKRESVIIGNVNRCRPPGNRQPTLEEAAICRPFLFREIAVVQPEVIVVMGNTALRNLLEVREGITRVRGKFQDFRGIKVMPTFHPAYLLRDPSKKRETWEDLKKVRDYLDNLPPRVQESDSLLLS
jgi:uracil-DNA glycosylase family 4